MAKYPDIAAATADGVVHYWPMSEESGTTIEDVVGEWGAEVYGDSFSGSELSPAEYDATAVSTPAGFGRDTGANWDGTSGNTNKLATIRFSQSPQSSSFSSITLRVRYFHSSRVSDVKSSQTMTLLWLGQLNNSGILIDIQNGAVYFSAGNSNSGSAVISDPFVVGEWHDVVVAGDGSGTRLYVNDALIHEMSGSSNFLIYNTPSYTDSSFFGGSPDGSYYLLNSSVDGIFQDACVWSRKLSAQEVSDLDSEGFAEPLITDTSPTTYDAELDATFPIEADFTVLANPVRAEMDAVLRFDISFLAYRDWVSKLPPAELQEVYRLVITGSADGLDDLYIGQISSWQATNQAEGRSVYLQAVIPAAEDYLPQIEARQRGQLVLQKGYRLSNGESQYEEIMRTRFDSLRPDRGQRALTITVSGYMQGKPISRGARTLTGVRSISTTNGKRRVRCEIDLFLQPGMTVIALNDTFRADFINYYVTEADKFCEVSER